MKISKAKYNWLVAQYNYRKNKEQFIEISDEEYQRLTGETFPHTPTGEQDPPQGDIENNEESNLQLTYLTIKALQSGKIIYNANDSKINGIIFNINNDELHIRYNDLYSYEQNIYEININKDDKIQIYKHFSNDNDSLLNLCNMFNFNYIIYGNAITIRQNCYNDFKNYNKFNIDNIKHIDIYLDNYCNNVNVYTNIATDNDKTFIYVIKNNEYFIYLNQDNITLKDLFYETYFSGGEWSGYIYNFKFNHNDNTINIIKNKNYNWNLKSFIGKEGNLINLPNYVNIIEE